MQDKIHHVHVVSTISYMYLLFIYNRKIQEKSNSYIFYETIERAKSLSDLKFIFSRYFFIYNSFLLIILVLNCLKDFSNIVYIE